MAQEIEITVLKYESDFTKRSKDIKKNTWFSFPNDLLLHPDFDEINGEEFKWFAWIISICSKLNQNKIRLNIQHAIKKLSLLEKDLFSMIEKLQGKQIDVASDQMATTARPDGDQSTASTIHYNTLQYTTIQNSCSDLQKVENKLPSLVPKGTSLKKTFSINQFQDFEQILTEQLKSNFIQLYPDVEFLKREFLKIHGWLLANPKKNLKSQRGWSQFVSGWLDRAWPKYQNTYASNKTQVVTDLEDRIKNLFKGEEKSNVPEVIRGI